MLREIEREEALKKIHKNEDVMIYHTKLKRMFSWKELMEVGKFLIDEPKKYDLIQNTKNDIKIQTQDIPDEAETTQDSSDSDDTTDKSESNVPKKRGRQITIDIGKLFALKRGGWTYKDIADELGCSVATVAKYGRDHDLEMQVMEKQSKVQI